MCSKPHIGVAALAVQGCEAGQWQGSQVSTWGRGNMCRWRWQLQPPVQVLQPGPAHREQVAFAEQAGPPARPVRTQATWDPGPLVSLRHLPNRIPPRQSGLHRGSWHTGHLVKCPCLLSFLSANLIPLGLSERLRHAFWHLACPSGHSVSRTTPRACT